MACRAALHGAGRIRGKGCVFIRLTAGNTEAHNHVQHKTPDRDHRGYPFRFAEGVAEGHDHRRRGHTGFSRHCDYLRKAAIGYILVYR